MSTKALDETAQVAEMNEATQAQVTKNTQETTMDEAPSMDGGPQDREEVPVCQDFNKVFSVLREQVLPVIYDKTHPNYIGIDDVNINWIMGILSATLPVEIFRSSVIESDKMSSVDILSEINRTNMNQVIGNVHRQAFEAGLKSAKEALEKGIKDEAKPEASK